VLAVTANGITRIASNGAELLANKLEIATAERDAARMLVHRLERMLARIGGQMTPEDQVLLREARALLVTAGMRPSDGTIRQPDPPEWTQDPPPFASPFLTRKP
jgi:hypothetical protein